MKRTVALIAVLVTAIACYWFVVAGTDQPATARRPSAATLASSAGDRSAQPTTRAATDARLETATFASGCFWCTESDFDKVAGVVTTTSGYTGGHLLRPTYLQVSSGGTGHVESVEITFDPAVVTYEQLLDVYWHNVDPFNDRGQFCDYGEQYRPVIWVHDEMQRLAATESKAAIERLFGQKVLVDIRDAETFYPAEDYHQDFHNKSGVRYRYYRWGCGRDARLAEIWRGVSD